MLGEVANELPWLLVLTGKLFDSIKADFLSEADV